MTSRIAALARRGRDEGGLSLVELMIAIGVLFVALLALARTATVAFTDVAVARQRQSGAQLANRLLEEIRGLPYTAVQSGLSDSDLTGDPLVQTCSGELYYRVCPPTAGAEKLVHGVGLPAMDPLVPHTGQAGPPTFPSTFSWRVYVTEASDVPSKGAYRVTVRVSWEATIRQGIRNFVEAQTLIYSPKGCVDPATHPFSAPCQPYYYGNGSAGGGILRTTGTVSGVAFDSIGFGLVGQAADAQVEQVTHVSGSVTLPSSASSIGGEGSGSPPISAGSAADDDPSTPTGSYQRQTTLPQAPSTVLAQGEGNQIAVSIGGSSTGASTSTTQASTANSCTVQTDNRPCGFATSTAAGSVTHTLVLSGGTGSSSLLSVSGTTSPVTTYVRRFVGVGGEPGLIRETVSWNLPQILLGGLPSGLVSTPSGWQGYWVRLTGFNASTSAEAGLGTVGPTAAVGGGQISYWNGRGYSSVPVTAAGGDVTNIIPVDFSAGTGDGNSVRVRISGTVGFQASGVSQQILSGSTRLKAQGDVGSPLVVNLSYRVSRNDVEIANLALEFTAGGARASAVYQPAPTP